MVAQTAFSQGAMWMAEVDQVIAGSPDNGSRPVGLLQNNELTFDWTTKALYGQSQFPAVIARGEAKVTGKSTFAVLDTTLIATNFFGLVPATGQFGIAQNEPQTVPATSPYTVTVNNASAFALDLGVVYAGGATPGLPLQRVTTPTGAGQYSVNYSTGVYTFSSADASASVKISYNYTNSTSGKLLTITNQLQGFTPYFRAALYNSISPNPPPATAAARPWAMCFNACTASKMSTPRKVNDFTEIEIDWEAFADGNDIVGYWSTLQ